MKTNKHALVSPAIGTQREVISFHFGPSDSGRKVYVQAALHADEPPGFLVAQSLKARLAQLEASDALRCEVVLVPVANPVGLGQWLDHMHIGRFELRSAENFNRHYPDVVNRVADAVGPMLTQDEASNARAIRAALFAAVQAEHAKTELASLRRVLFGLAVDAEVVLDLHCDSEAVMHLYTGSPLWPRVEPLARYLGAAATLLETSSGDHPFDEACSRTWWLLKERFPQHPIPLGCVSVTVELRGATDVSRELGAQDADAIIAYLQSQGMIAGDPPPMPALLHPATPLAGSEAIESPVSGVLDFRRGLGEMIRAGDVVAEVVNPITGEAVALKATTEGVLYARHAGRFIHTGMRIAKVAGATPFRTGNLLSAR